MAWYRKVKPTYSFPNLPDDLDIFSCADWKIYYEKLVVALGKVKASSELQREGGRAGMWANLQYCKYNCDWIRYFTKQGLPNGGNIFSKVYCAGDSVATAVNNAATTAGNVTGALSKLTNNPIIPIVAMGAIGYYFYKNHYAGKKKK